MPHEVVHMNKDAPKQRRVQRYIYRPWVTQKDGTKKWARDYGKKAWRIPVYED